MAAKSNQELIGELLERVGKLEHEVEVHKRALAKLIDKFALYWLEEHKEPVFAIKVNQGSKQTDAADLLVITHRLSAPDLKMRRDPIRGEEDEVKQGKWEPLVLPLPMLSALIQAEEAEGKDDPVVEPTAAAMFA
jgi:hypothetical protein